MTSPSDPSDPAEVLVVGAGPAGLAAADAATRAGARVVLVDEQPRPGGQYWRHGPTGPGPHHHGRAAWTRLAAGLTAGITAGTIQYRAGHRVWRVDPPTGSGESSRVYAVGPDETAVTLSARVLILAPGAHDRVLPFPGWDLPGVITAGAAQALLKEHGVVAGRRIVVGGTGPFLLPVAAGLAAAGARVVEVLEAGDARGWLRGGPAVLAVPGTVAEGLGYAATLARHRVRVRRRHAVVAAHGRDRLEAVTIARLDAGWQVMPGTARRVECDVVAVGWGFVARLDLALHAGCLTRQAFDGAPAVAVDQLGRTSVPGIFVAGEATGIGGAKLAMIEGAVAGRAAAGLAGASAPAAASPSARRRRLVGFAAAMHAAHPVRDGWVTWLDDDTLVCRCEEVPLSAVRAAVDELAATDARTVRLLTRAGMGWCQGRMCSDATARLVGAGASPLQRPIAAPLTLAALAGRPPESTHDHEEGVPDD